jgi:L-malate glycosyltransferase
LNILIYYPYNQRSVEQQSVMEMLVKTGEKVFLLTTCAEGYIHEYVRGFGVNAFASPVQQEGIKGYFKQAIYLRKFCRQNNIDIIFVHQQSAAFPAMLASPFIKARIAYFRHNSDEDYQLNPSKAKRMNGLLNRFIKRLIAPSQKVWQHWVNEEKVDPPRITRINYGYNFGQYEKADPAKVKAIQDEFPCQLRVVSIARLVAAKRHLLMFRCVQEAIKTGIDIRLICIGTGPDEAMLKQWIKDNRLEANISMLGYRSNIFDYLGAADIYMHLSSTEASNSSVKEAGLAACPCLVCKGVGDFEDYIKNEQNGFLVSKEPQTSEVLDILKEASADKTKLQRIGKSLQHTVREQFDIANVTPLYRQLITEMKK